MHLQGERERREEMGWGKCKGGGERESSVTQEEKVDWTNHTLPYE